MFQVAGDLTEFVIEKLLWPPTYPSDRLKAVGRLASLGYLLFQKYLVGSIIVQLTANQ